MTQSEQEVVNNLRSLVQMAQVAIEEIEKGELDSQDLRIAIKFIREFWPDLHQSLHKAGMTGAFGPIEEPTEE